MNDRQHERMAFMRGFITGVGVSLIITLIFRGAPV